MIDAEIVLRSGYLRGAIWGVTDSINPILHAQIFSPLNISYTRWLRFTDGIESRRGASKLELT